MIRFAKNDYRFKNVLTENFEKISGDNEWDEYQMPFNYSGKGYSGIAYFRQRTNKNNPLIRDVRFYDPDKNKWRNWERIDWNILE